MKYILVAFAAVAVVTAFVACTGAVTKNMQLYCIGIILILLGLMTGIYIYMDDSRFGEEPAVEKL
jgi:disulfide bond formation protein DsbB